MRTPIALSLVALVFVAACERRTATPGTTADSTAVSDSTADSTTRDTTAGAKVPTKVTGDSIIGRDSAFGPIGSINDTTGKFTPSGTKRP
jgi:hypothetical protein